MPYYCINHDELSALYGLPPLYSLTYLLGLKPYVDYQTGLVGIKRGISYQSLAEALYVAPHCGIQSGKPSKQQLRRVLQGLIRAGLLASHSTPKRLVFRLLLVTQAQFGQNQAGTKPTQERGRVNFTEDPVWPRTKPVESNEAGTANWRQPDIPLNSNNNYICLLKHFEQFWQLYPLKKGKQQAWRAFQALPADEPLLTRLLAALQHQVHHDEQLRAQGQWTAHWKYPANWLLQHCWDDELTPLNQEKTDAIHKNDTGRAAKDTFFEACKAGLEGDGCSVFIDYPEQPAIH